MADRILSLTPVWLLASACCCSPSMCLFPGRETPHTVLARALAISEDKTQEGKEDNRNEISQQTNFPAMKEKQCGIVVRMWGFQEVSQHKH